MAYPAGTGGYTTGEVVTYEHDPATGALTGAVSDTTSFKVDSVGYDYAGRMLSTLYGDTNGTREERAYEQSTGRLRYVYGGGAPSNSYYQHQRFFYDPGGNVTAVFDLRNPVAWASRQTLCYEYDDLDRLTRAYTQQTGSWPTNGPDCTGTPSMTAAGDTAEPGTGYDRTYTYGQAGNITAVNETYDDPTTTGDDRFTLTYTYPVAGQARPHAVTSVTDTSGPNWSFGYDQAGNMTTRVVDPASQALTYDPQNRLATVTDTGDVTTFGYDHDGNRLRTTTTGGGDRLYAGSWWETTMSGGGEVTYYRFNDAMVAYADTTGAVDYLFTDHLGSVTTTHGASGTLNNRYHPFGEPRDTLQVIDTDHGYTGQRRDTTTGLMYYQARYYDPTLRRFTQPDTIIPNPHNPQDLNRYTYTRNNPIRYTDPSGHKVCERDCQGNVGRPAPVGSTAGEAIVLEAAGVEVALVPFVTRCGLGETDYWGGGCVTPTIDNAPTEKEKCFQNLDLLKCWRANGRDQAYAFADQQLGNEQRVGWNEWNAVLHASWGTYLYFEFGAEHAQDQLWAHETSAPEKASSTAMERQMDFANDFYALQIGAAVDRLDVSQSRKVEIAQQLIVQALYQGGLCVMTAPADKGGAFVDPGRCG